MISATNLLLAQDANSADGGVLGLLNSTFSQPDILTRPDDLLNHLSNLNLLWGSIFFVVGILCILNGYKWHRWVMIVCAFLCGIALGNLLSHRMGESRVVMGALGLLCAVIATPMLRFTVAIFGGLTGAFIGANAWSAFSNTPESHLIGAAMGFILLGMASFILSRFVILLFTSIGGGALAVLGGITLLMNVPNWDGAIKDSLTANHLVIPLLVLVAAVTGFVRQQGASLGGSPAPKPKPA